MIKTFVRRSLPFVVACALAFYLAPRVFDLAHYRDKQHMLYNQAIAALASGNPAALGAAAEAFSASAKTWKAEQSANKDWWERYLLPQADQETASLALFHIGNLLRMQGKNEDALKAYVESLRLNPGQKLLSGVSMRDDGSHQYGRDFCVALQDKVAQVRPVLGDDCQLSRLRKQADDTRNNILSLLAANPELAKMLGNPGNMKPGSGQNGNGGKGPKQQVPGETPAPNQGQNDPDGI